MGSALEQVSEWFSSLGIIFAKIYIGQNILLTIWPDLGGFKLIGVMGGISLTCFALFLVIGIFSELFKWVEKRYGK